MKTNKIIKKKKEKRKKPKVDEDYISGIIFLDFI